MSAYSTGKTKSIPCGRGGACARARALHGTRTLPPRGGGGGVYGGEASIERY